MKRLALLALLCSAIASATIPAGRPFLGFGNQPAVGGPPSIITSSLSNASVGSATAQTLLTSCTNGPCSCNQVSASPDSGLWLYVTPGCTVSGTPEWAETDSITVQINDAHGLTATKTLSITAVASGSLAMVTSATLPACTNGGVCVYRELASGGVPPYTWSSPQSETPCYLSWDGFLTCAPTTTATITPTVTVLDSAGSTVSLTQSMAVNATLKLPLHDSTDGVIHWPAAMVGVKYHASTLIYGGTSPYTCSATGGLPAWATLSTSGNVCSVSGTPTASGAVQISLRVTDSATPTPNVIGSPTLVQILSNTAVSRPAYNSAASNGFFVIGGALYDYNGEPFTIRGIDHLHGDNTSTPGYIALTSANAVRTWDVSCTASLGQSLLADYQGSKILPILTLASITPTSSTCGGGSTGDTNPAHLAEMVAWWVANEPSFATYMQKMAVNIANEWGPGSTSTVWENAYLAQSATVSSTSGTTITVSTVSGSNPFANATIGYIYGTCGATPQVVSLSSPGGSSGAWTVVSSVNLGTNSTGCTLAGGAVGALRAAGYTCPLMIDAGGNGQDWTGITTYGQAMQASDPLQNLIFSYHPYGSVTNAQALVSGITTGSSTTVFTLTNTLPFHPFNPVWPTVQSNAFLFYGSGNMVVTGAQGMTSANGVFANDSHSHGSSGSWSMDVSVNSSGWGGTYTANSATIEYDNNYAYLIATLAALKSNNVAVCLCEFGPGSQFGNPLEVFTGGTGGVSSTTVTVSAVLASAGPILPQAINNLAQSGTGYGHMSGQSSGTAGGTGNYTLYNAATISNGTQLYESGTGNLTDNSGVGPSPGTVSPFEMVSAAEAYGLAGWNYWAWDDNNGGNNDSYPGGWFGMTGCCYPTGSNGVFSLTAPSDLTFAGLDVMMNTRTGLYTLPAPAGTF